LKILLFLFFLFFSKEFICQEKLIFTYIDHINGELRAALYDNNTNERLDLGFNNTFLPIWYGNRILLNSQSFIWISDASAKDYTKVCVGFKAAASNLTNKFAVYTPMGISIYDSNLNVQKKIDVDYSDNVSLTWLFNDSVISFFDADKESTVFYYLDRDSVSVFGQGVYHPVWNPKTNEILYNKKNESGFGVFLTTERKVSDFDRMISFGDEYSIVPIWSNKFDKIAYFRIKEDSLQIYKSDLILADIILYDFLKDKYYLIADDAGYTDQAYPQFTFDINDENIFYTAISEYSLGMICKVNISTQQKIILTKDLKIDERLPLYNKTDK